MKLKNILNEDKPREKLKNKGVHNLSDSDLLSILLRTGNKDESVNELSTRIIKDIGGISRLNQMSLSELLNIKGIKLAKATIILAAFELGRRTFNREDIKPKLENASKIFNYYKNEFKDVKQESFYVLLFDAKMNLLKRIELYKGTLDSVNIHPREVFKEALKESASSIIVMHNHPSGDTSPSDEDIAITERLQEVGELMGIKLLDHIIISSESFYSFFEASFKN